MLRYVLGGLGILFFFLIVDNTAQRFLERLNEASSLVTWAIISLPMAAIIIATLFDIIKRKSVQYKRTQPLLTTMGGLGFLFAIMLLANGGSELINKIETFQPNVQIALVIVPVAAMVASFLVTIFVSNPATPRKKDED